MKIDTFAKLPLATIAAVLAIALAVWWTTSNAAPQTPQTTPDTQSSKQDDTLNGEKISFNQHVRPILSDKCIFCHGPDAENREADLRLDTEAGAMEVITRGKPEQSALLKRIFHTDPDEIMPPEKSSRTLSDQEKNILTKWIKEGAPWQKHWAFEQPRKSAIKQTSEENPIDHFVRKKLKQKGLTMSPPASKNTLIRRASLDLTGLPPTPEEIKNFIEDDSPKAYEKLIDRLLTSHRYAEHMTWHWLEAARYADTDGYQNDGPRHMWRWRDWVLNAYKQNMPFDRFTIEQLAGDLLPTATLEQKIATGFNRNHRYNSESGLVLEEFLLENAVDRIDTTSTVWMGMTVACARCHDHKYDPISQKEYYQLISFFDAVPESGRAIKFGNSEPWIKAPTAEQLTRLTNFDKKIASLEKEMEQHEPIILEGIEKLSKLPQQKTNDIVKTGLTHRFATDSPIKAGGKEATQISDKINYIGCHTRFSLAFSVTPEQTKSGPILAIEGKGTGRQGFFIRYKDGHLQFSIVGRWIAGVSMIETLRTFEAHEKVHIAVTNDGTLRADGMKIYVNGKPAATKTILNTNSNKVIGKGKLVSGKTKYLGTWQGTLQDIRVYKDTTLGETEAHLLAKGNDTRRHAIENAPPNSPLAKTWKALEKTKRERLKFHDSIQTTMVMKDVKKSEPTKIRFRGEYHNKGEPVKSDVPKIFPALPPEYPRNRLGLAKWLVSGDHPLTARVTVNRYWQMLFGKGLVKTPEDFGIQGSLPSHPELLDWLALSFMENGWDTKALLKSIMLSDTYRQSSVIQPELLEKDPPNTWLARAPRLKLPGNILKDQALFASGLLVEKTGGPSVKPYQPKNLWKEASNFTYEMGKGDDLYRRSVYTYWKRTLAPPSMAVLDTADREWCSVKPKSTNTPLQALTLLNETAFFESARKLGEKILKQGGTTVEERLHFGFLTVLGRQASAEELAILTKSWATYREEFKKQPQLVKQLSTVGKSKQDKTLNSPELGAATAIANVLLNLEEAAVRE